MNAEAASDEIVDDLDDAEVVDTAGKPRKKSSMSPTKRTLKYLRQQGCQLVAVTERWNPYANVRQDLFGIIDVLAIKDDKVIAVQTTSTGVAARIQKMADAEFKNPETKQTCLVLPALFCAGIKVYVHGWRKNSKGKWILREVELS
jgi:hypothetical protein